MFDVCTALCANKTNYEQTVGICWYNGRLTNFIRFLAKFFCRLNIKNVNKMKNYQLLFYEKQRCRKHILYITIAVADSIGFENRFNIVCNIRHRTQAWNVWIVFRLPNVKICLCCTKTESIFVKIFENKIIVLKTDKIFKAR